MLTRRAFLAVPAGAAVAGVLQGAALSQTERIDRVLRGADVDRPPFTFWYHFGLQQFPGERHAEATLAFHRKFHTDLVKVMSDYPYPKPSSGAWYELGEEANPFPEQIRALEMIRDGLKGEAYFLETLFNPWNVAEKLSSKEEVLRLKAEKPQALLDALHTIARSEANHARRALAAGAHGIFLAIANAQPEFLSLDDYSKFSEPFDRLVLESARSAPLNVLHLHGDHVYLDRFYKRWPAAAINYSAHGTGVPLEKVRARYSGVLMGGLDERNFRTLGREAILRQAQDARRAAGRKLILSGGCSVPNETTDEEARVAASALQG